jgi:hypothetical protein
MWECSGIGRRAGFKIQFRKECRFDFDHPHHLTLLFYRNFAERVRVRCSSIRTAFDGEATEPCIVAGPTCDSAGPSVGQWVTVLPRPNIRPSRLASRQVKRASEVAKGSTAGGCHGVVACLQAQQDRKIEPPRDKT